MAIAHVQTSTMLNVAAGTGGTKTLTTTVDNYLIASSAYFANAGSLTVSDDKGNTWAAAKVSSSVGGNFNLASVWYAKVATGGSTVVTWALPSGSYLSAAVSEFSGLASSSVTDAAVENSGNSTGAAGGNIYTGPSTGTLAQADELVIAVYCSNTLTAVAIDAIPTGFSSIFTNPSGLVYQYGDGDYKIVAATTAVQPVWDFAGSAAQASAVAVVTFKATGAAAKLLKPYAFVAG